MRQTTARTSTAPCLEPNTDRPVKAPYLYFWLALIVMPSVAYGSHFEFFEPVQPPRAVQVMAHRGAAGQAPENTRPALYRCFEDTFEWAEIDIRLSRDGRHVLWHDGALDKLGLKGQRIDNLTAEELSRVEAGAWFATRYRGEHVLTLEEALTLAKGKLNLYLDCKQVDLELLVRDILAAGMENQVIVYEGPTRLETLRTIAQKRIAIMAKWHRSDGFAGWVETLKPDAVERYGLASRTIVYQSVEYLMRLKAVNPRIRALPPLSRPEQIDSLAERLQPYAVDARWDILSKEVIDRCHARGMKVFSDAMGGNEKIESYHQAMDWGIDLIQTDCPLRVYRAMELHAARNQPGNEEGQQTQVLAGL